MALATPIARPMARTKPSKTSLGAEALDMDRNSLEATPPEEGRRRVCGAGDTCVLALHYCAPLGGLQIVCGAWQGGGEAIERRRPKGDRWTTPGSAAADSRSRGSPWDA